MKKLEGELWSIYCAPLNQDQTNLINTVIGDRRLEAKIGLEILFQTGKGAGADFFRNLDGRITNLGLNERFELGVNIPFLEIDPIYQPFMLLKSALTNVLCESTVQSSFLKSRDSRYVSGKVIAQEVKKHSTDDVDFYMERGRAFWYRGKRLIIPDGVSVTPDDEGWKIEEVFGFARIAYGGMRNQGSMESISNKPELQGVKEVMEGVIAGAVNEGSDRAVSLNGISVGNYCKVGAFASENWQNSKASSNVARRVSLDLPNDRQLTYLALREIRNSTQAYDRKIVFESSQQEFVTNKFLKLWNKRLGRP